MSWLDWASAFYVAGAVLNVGMVVIVVVLIAMLKRQNKGVRK